MRVYLDQIGCRLNYSENDTLARRLHSVGHQTVSNPRDAHVIVFNSCAVTAEASRKSRQHLRKLNRMNPEARIAVTGCWSTLEPEKASALPGVSLVVDNSQKELLDALLEPWSAELDEPETLIRMTANGSPFDDSWSSSRSSDRTRAFIKVQDGCNNKCTFCIVTVARGNSRSRSTASIVTEIQELIATGVQEAVLTGVHLGSYGKDMSEKQETNLRELVCAILTHTDIRRLRLSSLEPWEIAEGFFDLWQQWPDRLCPHLHLPLQAGTNQQLRRMARRCTQESFRQLVADARAAIPDLVVTTDLIVGFPGESESDFVAGMAFVEEMRFAHAHIFPFSPRQGTAAATFAEQISQEIKKSRSRRMHRLLEQTGGRERQRFVGSVRPVLWEGEGRPLTDQPGLLWSGLTDNYLRVVTTVPAELSLRNRIIETDLALLDGDTLVGHITPQQNMTILSPV